MYISPQLTTLSHSSQYRHPSAICFRFHSAWFSSLNPMNINNRKTTTTSSLNRLSLISRSRHWAGIASATIDAPLSLPDRFRLAPSHQNATGTLLVHDYDPVQQCHKRVAFAAAQDSPSPKRPTVFPRWSRHGGPGRYGSPVGSATTISGIASLLDSRCPRATVVKSTSFPKANVLSLLSTAEGESHGIYISNPTEVRSRLTPQPCPTRSRWKNASSWPSS